MQVRYGNCTDAFVFDESVRTVIVSRDQPHTADSAHATATPSRLIAVGGKIKGDQLTEAHDVGLSKLQGNRNCSRVLYHGRYTPTFVYDLRTRERKFKLHRKEGICREAEGRECGGTAGA